METGGKIRKENKRSKGSSKQLLIGVNWQYHQYGKIFKKVNRQRLSQIHYML